MHTIVVDLSFGDSGKGTTVDWLCARRPSSGPPVRAVVRFNGGAQAAHNVLTVDGRHHTFAQLGSGSFTPDVKTHLSRFVLVEPMALAAEAERLARLDVVDPLGSLTIDRRALLTTPFHQAANRARELRRGSARHGSCGLGIGETMSYAIDHQNEAPVVGDCQAPNVLRRKLAQLRDAYVAEGFVLDVIPSIDALVEMYRAFADRVAIVDDAELVRLLRAGPVVFEGAQGVLLDEWRGFHPYTTWSTTTFGNAETLLAEAGIAAGDAFRLGVVRAYTTRHGAGPFVTEDPSLVGALPEPHNGHGLWQGEFRVGHLDAIAHRYAIEVCGRVDGLAVTHLDRVTNPRRATTPALRLCDAYDIGGRRLDRLEPGPFKDLQHQERLTQLVSSARPVYRSPSPDVDWAATIEDALGVPVVMESHGPTAADKVVFEGAHSTHQ